MKNRCFALLGLILFPAILCSQQNPQKFALVIGNGAYTSIEKLTNPINDAADIAAKLRALGYQVDLQTNVRKTAMDRAIHNYIQRLASDRENEGFFWFAGHGVQIDGENYLLPTDVDSTDDLSVKHTSYSVRLLLDSFDLRARNKVNIVVLDACRNNPFRSISGGTRSLSRGLGVVSDLPPDLLIIYSTAPGEVAADGTPGKRNSPFAEAFLNNMDRTEDITIVVRGISRETLQLTNNRQEPFTGGRIRSLDYYSLNPQSHPTPAPSPTPQPASQVSSSTGNIPLTSEVFGMVRIQGGTFAMGSPTSEPGRVSSHETQRQVTVSSFWMGRYPVTQAEYDSVMGTNPSSFRGFNLPVENVSWFDAIEYCNRRSQIEGLTPAYRIRGSGDNRTVGWNRRANGYRLPTEAEWEYACRAGTTTSYNTVANISDATGWYSGNSERRTQEAGNKPANAWGLHDMHGNVYEWCWDWYGVYPSRAQTNPVGAFWGLFARSELNRVSRGGSWFSSSVHLRSAYRGNFNPTSRNSYLGFRVVRS